MVTFISCILSWNYWTSLRKRAELKNREAFVVMSSTLYCGLVAWRDFSLVFELIILSYSFLSVVFTPWFSWKKRQIILRVLHWPKAQLLWYIVSLFFNRLLFFFLLLFSTAFVNAGHELHNVSGHLSVNWSYLIIEMKRENPAKYLFYGMEATFCRAAVRRGGFRWCTEYISWS